MTPEVRAPILAALQRVYTDLQDADVAPTAAAVKAASEALEGARARPADRGRGLRPGVQLPVIGAYTPAIP